MDRRSFISALTGASIVSVAQLPNFEPGNDILIGKVEGDEDLEAKEKLDKASDTPPQPKAWDIDLPSNTDFSFGFTRIEQDGEEKLAVYISVINTSNSSQSFVRSVKLEGSGVQRVEKAEFELEPKGNHVSFYTHPNIEAVDSIYIL